jgi:hypothetical protein
MWTLCSLLVASPQTPGEKILQIFSSISQHVCVVCAAALLAEMKILLPLLIYGNKKIPTTGESWD